MGPLLIGTMLVALPLVGGSTSAPDPLQPEQYGLEQSRFPSAWPTSTGSGSVIAIVDTGVDADHPDLVGRLVPGHDFVEGDDVAQDENGHGTHVSGIAAAATGNGVGGAGGAPGAKIMPIRVLDADGNGDPDVVAQGIGWAVDHGATVINLSLGGDGPAARLLKGGRLNGAIRDAAARGAVVVAAAGNSGQQLRPFRLAVPVLVVDAVDRDGQVAAFSNYGDARAVAAAGVDILSTAPRQPTTSFPSGTDGYAVLSGTSMAAPLVAAEAALLLAQGRSAAEVPDIIARTAHNPTGDPRLGAGVVDAAGAVDLAGGTDAAAVSTAAAPRPDLNAAGGSAARAAATDRGPAAADRGPAATSADGSGPGPAIGLLAGALVVVGAVVVVGRRTRDRRHR